MLTAFTYGKKIKQTELELEEKDFKNNLMHYRRAKTALKLENIRIHNATIHRPS